MGVADRMNGRVGEKYGGRSLRTENDQIENLRAAYEDRGWLCHIMSCHTNPDGMSGLLWPISTVSVLSKLRIPVAFKSVPEVCNR